MSVEAVGLGTGAHLADARRALRMALLVSRASRASRADLRLDTRSCQANANPQPQEKRCAQGRWRRALKLALQPPPRPSRLQTPREDDRQADSGCF